MRYKVQRQLYAYCPAGCGQRFPVSFAGLRCDHRPEFKGPQPVLIPRLTIITRYYHQ